MRGCEFPSDDELLFDDEDLEEDAPSHRDGTKKKKHEGATMKIKWNSLRRLIREEIKRSGLLTEVACPVCGTEGAYVGLHDVECVNPKCRHYVPSKLAQPKSERPTHPKLIGTLMMFDDIWEIENEFPGAFKAWRETLVNHGYDVDVSESDENIFYGTYFDVSPNGTLAADWDNEAFRWDGEKWMLN